MYPAAETAAAGSAWRRSLLGNHSAEIHRRLKKQEKNRSYYLCFADWYYVLFVLSSETSYHENTVIQLKNFKAAPGSSPKAKAIVAGRSLVGSKAVVIPKSIEELILQSAGTYPITNNLKLICLGTGGLCIIAMETKTYRDIYDLIKFSRELAEILEQEYEQKNLRLL